MRNKISLYLERHGFGQFSPKAVLFDMDGVIYDSMPNHSLSWHEAMADFGLEMPLSGAYEYEGMRGVETIKKLARQQWKREISEEEAQKMYAHKSEVFSACKPAELMPGIKELMEQIKACGLKICVVTGSAQHVLLDKLGSDLKGETWQACTRALSERDGEMWHQSLGSDGCGECPIGCQSCRCGTVLYHRCQHGSVT